MTREIDAGVEGISDRYEIIQPLGRGGMAAVHRVKDRASGREFALKLLFAPREGSTGNAAAALFEREFHTLAQLRHPHVISVYDYGVSANSCPYYTMELLDGGDLRERAPVPWPEACRLFFEVCSSLALLHSRRLLHRDISPRNIRCTRDGRAKLIDFGAMAPMTAGGAVVVGTPAFIAPETLHRLALDARTDLFSLGATLYHALTGRLAYSARTLADSVTAWSTKVAPPSAVTPGIPPELDDLVLALISVEPALRPQSAFEVMQRLAAIAGLESNESEAVSAAYLATPTLVGRQGALDEFRDKLLASRLSRGGALVIEARSGMGRSRMLDACALEAKTLGFTVMRGTVGTMREAFATAHGLTKHLLESLTAAELEAAPPELFTTLVVAADSGDAPAAPELKYAPDRALTAAQLQRSISSFWLRISRRRPLLIAVDEVHRIDASSAAVIAALLDESRRAGVFVALTIDSDEPPNDASAALVRRCTSLPLQPLWPEQTHELLASLFGDVPNLDMLADEIHQVALGNPRQTMDLAQHLVDRGLIRYAAGTWTLPNYLSSEDLPRSSALALRARIESVSKTARFLAETQALAFYEALRDQDYHALVPGESAEHVERALSELLAIQALVADGQMYTLANRLWITALTSRLEPDDIASRHRALAAMYAESSRIAFIYHAFAGGMYARGHEELAKLNAEYAKGIDHAKILEQNIPKMMQCYPQAFASAAEVGLSARALNDLRRWNFAGITTVQFPVYPASTPAWLAQLERDSGLDLYRADPDTSDPMQRLMRALQGAQARQLATPEADRVYTIEEALKLLAEYVVFSLVISGRCYNIALLRSLPPLLEPFVALSPLLDAIWINARGAAANLADGEYERARELWTAALHKLDAMNDGDMTIIKGIADAVAFAVGTHDVQFGLPSAASWADRLDRDVYQRVSALQLRRIVRLEQGDWKGAERYRRQAEIISLQSRVPQMFKSLLVVELDVCAKAGDLAGVQDVIERMRPMTAHYPGWLPVFHHATAWFDLVRGDFEAAKRKFQECIAQTEFEEGRSASPLTWFSSHRGWSEACLHTGDAERARNLAAHAIERWQSKNAGKRSPDLVRALALAEAKLGDPNAGALLESAIAEQIEVGVTGLRIGLSYEARARIAIWQNDAKSFERYAELTAREYRYGAGSPLGARYDRLLNDAARHGFATRHALSDFGGAIIATTAASEDLNSVVMRTMSRARRSEERAQAALELICASRNASSGHLYLMSPSGLSLSASQGAPVSLPDLSELNEFISNSQKRTEALDDMVTGELEGQAAPLNSLLLDGVRYDVLLLSCNDADDDTAVGVALIAANDSLIHVSRQSQLLEALAKHLLGAGDTTGFAAG